MKQHAFADYLITTPEFAASLSRVMSKQIAERDAHRSASLEAHLARMQAIFDAIPPAPPCCECARLAARVREFEAHLALLEENRSLKADIRFRDP